MCPLATLYSIIDKWKEYCQEGAVTANHPRSEIKKENLTQMIMTFINATKPYANILQELQVIKKSLNCVQ
jgi:hypothetical protein